MYACLLCGFLLAGEVAERSRDLEPEGLEVGKGECWWRRLKCGHDGSRKVWQLSQSGEHWRQEASCARANWEQGEGAWVLRRRWCCCSRCSPSARSCTQNSMVTMIAPPPTRRTRVASLRYSPPVSPLRPLRWSSSHRQRLTSARSSVRTPRFLLAHPATCISRSEVRR
jgi:hypothetical protein